MGSFSGSTSPPLCSGSLISVVPLTDLSLASPVSPYIPTVSLRQREELSEAWAWNPTLLDGHPE